MGKNAKAVVRGRLKEKEEEKARQDEKMAKVKEKYDTWSKGLVMAKVKVKEKYDTLSKGLVMAKVKEKYYIWSKGLVMAKVKEKYDIWSKGFVMWIDVQIFSFF